MRLSPRMRIVAVLVAFDAVVILGMYLYAAATSPPSPSSAAGLTGTPQRAEVLGEATATVVPTPMPPTSTPNPTPTPRPTMTAAPSPALASKPVAAPSTATPTSPPSPSPTAASTASATPVPGSPTSQDPRALLQELSRQEGALRSGQLSAVLNLGTGESSIAEVFFDLGGAEPRLRSKTTYTGAKSSRTLERIVVGSRAWQRQQAGDWSAVTEEEGVAGRLRDYLPGADATSDVRREPIDARTTALRWYDPTRDADVTVNVDAATGTPLFLSRVSRGSKSVLTVNYVGWNVPVEIEQPSGA